jgi:hypothetical protein
MEVRALASLGFARSSGGSAELFGETIERIVAWDDAVVAMLIADRGQRESEKPLSTDAMQKWRVLKGCHVFRQSFISTLASKGMDQRVIDVLVGHSTDEQRRRYRHLYPDVMQKALPTCLAERPVPLPHAHGVRCGVRRSPRLLQ